jgi:hypothetical protein
MSTGVIYTRYPLPPAPASTFRANRIVIDKPAEVAEADSIIQAYIRAYHALVPKRTLEEEAAEEREWHAVISQPHVQQALLRLAEEVRGQIAAGETEEDGFAVE